MEHTPESQQQKMAVVETHTQRLSQRIDIAYEAYKAGEAESEDLLYRAFRAQAHNIVGRTPELDPRTLEQDIIRRAMLAIEKFRGDCRISTWFWKIAENEKKRALSQLIPDRQRFVPFLEEREDDFSGEDSDVQKVAHRRFLTDRTALEAEFDLRKLAHGLPREQAIVLRLYREGYSLQQIAKKTGEPLGTIRSRYRLLKQSMKARTRRTSPQMI